MEALRSSPNFAMRGMRGMKGQRFDLLASALKSDWLISYRTWGQPVN